jgi:hypothetical protein
MLASKITCSDCESERQLCAFVDEYGNPNLRVETEGVSTYYIVTAVLLPAHQVPATREAADAVRAKYFGHGEMKSNSVGRNDKRRLRVLHDLVELPFQFVSLVVDKQRIRQDSGLKFKKSFIKFVYRQLFQKLYCTHPDLLMVADDHGRDSFMDGFRDYVARHVERDLFRRPHFEFRTSRAEPLLQVADFVTGTVARLYDPKTSSPRSPEFVELLRPKVMVVLAWPPADRPVATLGGEGIPADRKIREYALGRVIALLANAPNTSEPEETAQYVVAERLLFVFQFMSENKYVSTAKLRKYLADQGIRGFDDLQQFRSRVIAPLRDRGLLIASSPKGYKIPASVSDVMDFVQHTDKVVYPMIRRLERARDSIRLATDGAVDIIGEEQFTYMRTLLDQGPLDKPRETELSSLRPQPPTFPTWLRPNSEDP